MAHSLPLLQPAWIQPLKWSEMDYESVSTGDNINCESVHFVGKDIKVIMNHMLDQIVE
jgi:hypothetical protein